MDEKEALARKVLFIILIVIIFISIVGTWTILDTVNNLKRQKVTTVGNVVLPFDDDVKQDSAAVISVNVLPSNEQTKSTKRGN